MRETPQGDSARATNERYRGRGSGEHCPGSLCERVKSWACEGGLQHCRQKALSKPTG